MPVNPHGTAGLVGPIVQGVSSLLLLVVFGLVHRFNSRRPFLRTWIAAWAAQLAVCTGLAVASLAMLGGVSLQAGTTTTFLEVIRVPGQFVFLVMTAIGALEAAGKEVTGRWQVWITMGAAATGLLIAVAGQPQLASQVQVILTPLVFFGGVQFVLAAAKGPRRRGMLALALALTLYGTLASLYLLASLTNPNTALLSRIAITVSHFSGYSDAVALTILGAAVIVLVIQDTYLEAVSAREEQVRVLVGSKQRLHDIIQAAGEAILTVDGDGKIDVVNRVAEEMFGLLPGGATGRGLTELLGILPAPLVGLLKDRSGNQPHSDDSSVSSFVGEGRRTDGGRFPIECTVAGLFGTDQAGAVVVIRDVTQRRQAEAQRELSERRLAESEKVLAVSRVVSSVIHELEHPLDAMLDQSERLLQASGPVGAPPGLRVIKDQASRALHIIRDLTAFIRVGPDLDDLVDLCAVVRAEMATLADAAIRSHLTLTAELPERVPLARANRAGVEQVIRGLFDNAIEAAGTGGTVRSSVRVVNRRVEVAVEDTGAGVPAELVERIFEPSFTTKAAGKATGLGLSISARVVKAFDGSLRLENRPAPGIGARFVLSLPTALSDASSDLEV